MEYLLIESESTLSDLRTALKLIGWNHGIIEIDKKGWVAFVPMVGDFFGDLLIATTNAVHIALAKRGIKTIRTYMTEINDDKPQPVEMWSGGSPLIVTEKHNFNIGLLKQYYPQLSSGHSLTIKMNHRSLDAV